ncbi:hypothetical protein D5R40_32140 [Okeania hirsuta]|uniref:Uncharacterized protein n=1 Tax=Okeania hirsuta TaxID=1458930 RepID=A0A3N6P230_9CYAN|nr:hypothetical protein D5R40_32140 [Okeania hirsuta]
MADLVFGPRGSDAVFASPLYSNSAQIVNQLYAYWNVSENATLTMGNFNTFLGYEDLSYLRTLITPLRICSHMVHSLTLV